MLLGAKICGLSEIIQIKTCIKHGASMLGFILFYPKSHRNLSLKKVKKLTSLKHTKSNVAVMVDPTKSDLKKIKNFNFQYYQIYGNQKGTIFLYISAPTGCLWLRRISQKKAQK